MLSDRDSEDPQSLVTSSDDEHLLSASEVQEVATSLGHQAASSTASEVVQEATATTEVEEEKSISDVMEVTSDKDESVRAKQELSSVGSATDDISDIMDLLEDTGDYIKISSWNKLSSGLSNGLAPSRQDKKHLSELMMTHFTDPHMLHWAKIRLTQDGWDKTGLWASTKRADVLPQDFVKSRSRKIHIQTFPIALKFKRRCRDACQNSERYDHYNARTRGIDTRDRTGRRPSA